jgi:Protein of unknown function (DUF4235)
VQVRRVPELIGRKRMWKLVSTVSGMIGAMVAQKVIRAAYRSTRTDKSPTEVFDPTSARFSWPDAVVWAAAAGVGLGIAKVVSARVAAFSWEVATGTLPPGTVEDQAVV